MGNWARACIVYGFTVSPTENIVCPNQLAKWKCDWYWESIRSRPYEVMAGVGIIYGVEMYDGWTTVISEQTPEMNLIEQLRVLMQSQGFAVEDKCSTRVALCGDISHEYYQVIRLDE